MKYYRIMESPVGRLLLVANDETLQEIRFYQDDKIPVEWDRDNDIIRKTIEQLAQYFKGKRTKFDLPLSPRGTAFQQQTWQMLIEIPYGKTISYQELAIRMGGAEKAHAVGAANGRNPIPIIIPCHRVIAKDGSLGGYAGGLDLKTYLLLLESTVRSES